jgi:hypothetical protein
MRAEINVSIQLDEEYLVPALLRLPPDKLQDIGGALANFVGDLRAMSVANADSETAQHQR